MKRQLIYGLSLVFEHEQHLDTAFLFFGALTCLIVIGFTA